MKNHLNLEARELFQMTILVAAMTVLGVHLQHPRVPIMIFLTVLMVLITFVAQYRRRRTVSTLHKTGRRKRTKNKSEQ